MGISQYLICMDCGEKILLGKFHGDVRYRDVERRQYAFASIGYTDKEGFFTSERSGVEVLQHFLYLHRGHELRVLPDSAQKFGWPDTGFPDCDNDPDPDYDRLLFLERDGGVPNAEKELEALPEEVKRKLDRFNEPKHRKYED